MGRTIAPATAPPPPPPKPRPASRSLSSPSWCKRGIVERQGERNRRTAASHELRFRAPSTVAFLAGLAATRRSTTRIARLCCAEKVCVCAVLTKFAALALSLGRSNVSCGFFLFCEFAAALFHAFPKRGGLPCNLYRWV